MIARSNKPFEAKTDTGFSGYLPSQGRRMGPIGLRRSPPKATNYRGPSSLSPTIRSCPSTSCLIR